jgi:hypothetical protein
MSERIRAAKNFSARRIRCREFGAAEIAALARLFRQLAVIVRDGCRLLRGGELGQPVVNRDRVLPIALLLVDAQQMTQRRHPARIGLRQLPKRDFGAIEQARAEVVLGQREHRLQTMLVAELRPRHDVTVVDRALHLRRGAGRGCRARNGVSTVSLSTSTIFRKTSSALSGSLVEQEAEPLQVVLVPAGGGS